MICANPDFAMRGAVKANLIWTNDNPGNAFDDQTLQFDLFSVKMIMVIFRVSRAIGSLNPPLLVPAGQTARCVSDALTAGIIYRNVAYNDKGVIFSGSTNNSGCIPYAIYTLDF